MTNNQVPSLIDLDIENCRRAIAAVGVTVAEFAEVARKLRLAANGLLPVEPEERLARQRSEADLAAKRIPARRIVAGARLAVTIKSRTGQPGKRMRR